MDSGIEQAVRDRARGLCEYCHAPQAFYPERFQLDHIIARQHRGGAELENLALCCLECNRRKGPNIASIDPQTLAQVELYHPRRNGWNEHFSWRSGLLIGATPVGRATVALLDINRPPRVAVRQALIAEGVFPPAGDRREE
jgi:hypothetical protein